MTRTLAILAATTALALSFTTVANAQMPGMPRGKKTFSRLDTNKDNQLQLDELMPKSESRFMRLDTDGDGKVSSAELDAWLQRMAEKRKQGILSRMDKDGDGAVSKAEVDEYIGIVFAAADADSSGGVTLQEAKAYHGKRRK
jgi:Ca2+-binding EF-hand superfamily protein